MKRFETILIVDDDTEITELLQQYLNDHGFPNVLTAGDGPTTHTILQQHPVDLVILDIMLPGEDGFAIAESIRSERETPILFLSARVETADRIHGLKIGADDYMTKPFDPEELLARIQAILRRSSAPSRQLSQSLQIGEIVLLMPERVIIRRDHKRINLTTSEYRLLEALIQNNNRPLSRDQIAYQINGKRTTLSSRAIDVQVSRLRSRIGDHQGVVIETVRNQGYVILQRITPLLLTPE